MAEVHVVQMNLIKLDPEGNILDGKSTIGARAEFSTEHRVMMNANVPNTFSEDSEESPVPAYPTTRNLSWQKPQMASSCSMWTNSPS